MKNNTRKILVALLLVFAIMMSFATVTSFAAESDEGTTVYFENNWLWTDVCCYYWGDGIAAPQWPGVAMTNVGTQGGHELYSFDVPAGATGIIFNGIKDNGSGDRDQSPDITSGIVNGAGWMMDWNDGNTVKTFTYVNNDAPVNPPVEDTPTDPTTPVEGGLYLIGYINGADVADKTYPIVDGKVTVNSSAAIYVAVMDESGVWYMTDGWLGENLEGATLYNSNTHTLTQGKFDKFHIPAGEVTILVTANADGSYYITTDNASGNEPGDEPFVDVHSSYTVAGTAGLCGAEWDTSNTANDLVLGEDGVYSITYTNVPAGEHKFKVAADHAWDNAWPSSDYSFTLTEACDVTIKFNPQTKKVEVVADKIDTTTPPASDGLYTVAGQSALCGSDWSTSDTYNDMILNPETGLYEKTFTGIPAGFYECKVVLNHSWDVSYGGDSGEYGNYGFTIDEELNVTITFDPVACIVSHYTSESTGAVERPEPEKPDINYDETITIYLSNSANWETPYVYYWTQGAADQNAAWPGVPMEWDGEKLVYYVNVPTYYVNIIFNDGNGTQTADLYIPEDGSIYDNVSNEWGNIKNFTPPAKPENTTTDVTVYVKDDLGWGDVYIYFWDESGIEAAVWPGVPMELGEDGYYHYTIPAGFSNVIFNNGGSWEDGSLQQTSDLSIPKDGKVYISNSAENDKGWYGVGGNSGDNNNNNSTDTPVTPETPKAELSFLQKLAYQLLLWLRSIEEFFKNMFVGNKA